MTEVACAMIVADAKKAAVEAESAILTPDYQLGFVRPCCPIDPTPTHLTAPTHWYMHAAAVPGEYVEVWQNAVDDGENEAMAGLVVFTALNASNAVAWAVTNLASEGLMFVPDDPNA